MGVDRDQNEPTAMKTLLITVFAILLCFPLIAQEDTNSPGYIPDTTPRSSGPNAQEALEQQGDQEGKQALEKQQEYERQLALVKAQADAAAEAQIKVNQAEAYQQSIARAEAEYPDSAVPDSSLFKAIQQRFATMDANDPLWQNPNRAEIIAREQANLLDIKPVASPAPDPTASSAQPQPPEQTVEMGTGFFVTTNGYLLTDFHVVTGAHLIQVKDRKGIRTAKLVARDPINDLAVLKVDGTTKCLPLGDSSKVTLGQGVFTIGFPNPDVQGLSPKLTKGEVSSLAGLQDDPRMYQISAPVQPGNSGGCLVDDAGNVVGIISSKLDTVAMAKATGDIPQNVNYALKISYAKLLLDTLADSKGGFAQPNTAAIPFDKDAATVQDSTVMVIAQ